VHPNRSLLFTTRVALVLALLLPPLAILLAFTRRARKPHRVRQCARAVMSLAGCRVRVWGIEHLPATGPAILVSNHASLADAAVLLAALPFDFQFVANHQFAGYAILGAAVRGASAHIVDRGSWRSRADVGQGMVDTLAAGGTLLVFPEGTTSPDGALLPFRNGAFRAAARSGSPVVPVVVRGTRELLPPDTYMMANVPMEIELLPAIVATAASRDAVAALRDGAAAAIGRALRAPAD
jgi:1-acyl-sn-glycerol-3-phosphate acyltransferase